jgi:hypothetical protein
MREQRPIAPAIPMPATISLRSDFYRLIAFRIGICGP